MLLLGKSFMLKNSWNGWWFVLYKIIFLFLGIKCLELIAEFLSFFKMDYT